jgi:hypothetical protein
MNTKREHILDQLLEEIRKGKSVDDCLSEWPEQADEIKPLLELACSINDLPVPEPNEQAVAETLQRVHQLARAEPVTRKPFFFKHLISWQPVFVRAVAALLLIVVVGWTTFALGARSLPGEPLYPLKRLTEKILYFVTVDAQGRAELHLRFADRRTQEFIYVLAPGEQIDRSLLSEMLNEMHHAFSSVEQLPEGSYAALMQRVADFNNYQRTVLESTRSMACDCDHTVLDEAVSLCHERDTCLQCHHQQKTDQQCFCGCWQREYHFE